MKLQSVHTFPPNSPIKELNLSRGALSLAFADLGDRLTSSRSAGASKRRATAEGFNVFDFIAPSENVLSDILAFLLDPQESHGQGMLFLEKLVSRTCSKEAPILNRPVVARESLTYAIPNHRRRIDIQVTLPDFVLAIETKKFTDEGKNQVADYCDHLSKISGNQFCLVFLTLTGDAAVSISAKAAAKLKQEKRLICWSWERDIPAWLEVCQLKCEAPKVRHFLEDFRTYIDKYLATQQPEEADDEQE